MFLAELLVDRRIVDVYVDPDVVYIMLDNGTQITVHGAVKVEPQTVAV